MTNYELIVNAGDPKELAKILFDCGFINDCEYCPFSFEICKGNMRCYEAAEIWLKQNA